MQRHAAVGAMEAGQRAAQAASPSNHQTPSSSTIPILLLLTTNELTRQNQVLYRSLSRSPIRLSVAATRSQVTHGEYDHQRVSRDDSLTPPFSRAQEPPHDAHKQIEPILKFFDSSHFFTDQLPLSKRLDLSDGVAETARSSPDDQVERLGVYDTSESRFQRDSPVPLLIQRLPQQRQRELEIGLTRSWANGPEALFEYVLDNVATRGTQQPDLEWEAACWSRVAGYRTSRLPVILLQVYLRRAILRGRRDLRHLLGILPKGAQLRSLLQHLGSQGYTRDDMAKLIWMLEGHDDNVRAQRFLDLQMPKPAFLLRFLVRVGPPVLNGQSLSELIEYAHRTYDGSPQGTSTHGLSEREVRRLRRAQEGMSTKLFVSTLRLLAWKCNEVDSRLLIRVSDFAIQYMRNIGKRDHHTDRIFHDRCFVFNMAMAAIGRDLLKRPPRFYRAMGYVWHALKSLLSESMAYGRPLVMNHTSFLAVRETLAGTHKSQSERHNSARHSQTWPPYLKAGDGIDEMVVPDENWSRTVQAGVVQQEAGYPKSRRDQALDTMQGTAPDGTPTIQQRTPRNPRRTKLWEASIRATRNAEEAWAIFRNPPDPLQQPELHEYAAMFKKLFQKTVWEEDDGPMIQPGDRDLSFPTEHVNLSDYAKAAMKPPTVEELYERMLEAGILPRSTCLDILVANTDDTNDVHRYLDDSELDFKFLTSKDPEIQPRDEIIKPRLSLVASYVSHLCSARTNSWWALSRAVKIIRARLLCDPKAGSWAGLLWGHVFTGLRVPASRTHTGLIRHVDIYLDILDELGSKGTTLPMFLQFCKSLRRAVTVHLDTLIADIESGDKTPYIVPFGGQDEPSPDQRDSNDASQLADFQNFKRVASRLKDLFEALVERERVAQAAFGDAMTARGKMMSRRDPARPKDALNMMSCLGFMGEFEQMASYLSWLAKQWGDEDLQNYLAEKPMSPAWADFTDVLCTFRLFAEPMLDDKRVAELRDLVGNVGLGWTWPSDELVTLFVNSRSTPAFRKMRHLLEWVRLRQQENRHQQKPSSVSVQLQSPKRWTEVARSSASPWTDSSAAKVSSGD
jgi:hypothetical protein